MPDEARTTVPPEPDRSSEAGSAAAEPGSKAASHRKIQGDVHVGTMAGDVKRVPGSGTENGDKALADLMRDVLERVRRSIRERAGSNRRR